MRSPAATLFAAPLQSVNEIWNVAGTQSPTSPPPAVRLLAGQNRGRTPPPSTRSPTRLLTASTDTALLKQHSVILEAASRSTFPVSAALISFLLPASTELCVSVRSVNSGTTTRRGSAPLATPRRVAPVLVTGVGAKAAVPLAAIVTSGESCASMGLVTWVGG